VSAEVEVEAESVVDLDETTPEPEGEPEPLDLDEVAAEAAAEERREAEAKYRVLTGEPVPEAEPEPDGSLPPVPPPPGEIDVHGVPVSSDKVWGAVVKRAANVFAAEYLDSARRPPPEPGSPYLTASELDALPPAEPLVTDVLVRDSYAVLAGRDGTFKSFVALDWSMHVATAREWLGRPVCPAPVLYSVGEGLRGMRARKLAWEARWDVRVPDDMITFRRRPVDLFGAGDEFEEMLVRAGHYGLIVLDTLQRHSGAADGNGSDMSTVVGNIKRLQRAMLDGAGTVLVVAHTGKTDRDVRGFSGIEDDADTVWHVTRDKGELRTTLRCEKQKDAAEPSPITVALHPVGDSLVVEAMTMAEAAEAAGSSEELFLTVMRDVFGPAGATMTEFGVAVGAEMSRSVAYRVRKELLDSRALTANKQGRMWAAEKED
jgi:hypothetical protein